MEEINKSKFILKYNFFNLLGGLRKKFMYYVLQEKNASNIIIFHRFIII